MNSQELAPIYIVSGGSGASATQLVHTVLAQFPKAHVPVITTSHVRHNKQLEAVVSQAIATDGTIVYTLIDSHLRTTLMHLSNENNLVAIDLMGELLVRLSEVLDRGPVEQPGLYRQLNRDYFERVSAIDFAIAHDDGKSSQTWSKAEIVLAGVSRVGKTPLSMYLAVLGWKVANVPLVPEFPPPPKLFQLDRHRVIGLTIDPTKLLAHRRQRQRRLGTTGPSAYAEPVKLFEEVETARRIFKQGGFSVLDITDKPMETSADEVVELITRRTKGNHKRKII